MLGKGLNAMFILFHRILMPILKSSYMRPHFSGKKTEAQRGE